jgi:selenium metabolism protein YedF
LLPIAAVEQRPKSHFSIDRGRFIENSNLAYRILQYNIICQRQQGLSPGPETGFRAPSAAQKAPGPGFAKSVWKEFSMTEIDARALSCPAPVLMAKAAVENEHPDVIRVRVDNEASRQNVIRFLESQSYKVSVEERENEYCLTGSFGEMESFPEDAGEAKPDEDRKIMVMVSTDRMGYGDDALGLLLMTNFLKTLNEMGGDLWRLVFVNNGVRLAVEGSEVLDVLQHLEAEGVLILVCGTCLTHFGLLEKKQAGETTNMLDIVTAMQLADKVINI